MKFLTAMTLGLLSLNALALPVLYEAGYGKDAHLVPDHSDPNKMHFIPDSGKLNTVLGRPLFNLFELGDEDEEKPVLLMAGFRTEKSWSLQGAIDQKIADGKDVSLVPALSSYLVMNSHSSIFTDYEIQKPLGRFEDQIVLSTNISYKSADLLPVVLNAPLARACYTVSGVSPKLEARMKMDINKVMGHFIKKHIDSRPYTQQEIINDLAMLIKIKWIKADIKGDDATLGDYAFALSQRLIKTNFVQTDDNRYEVVMKEQEMEDKIYTFNQRELVEKEFCVDLSISALENFPELLKY